MATGSKRGAVNSGVAAGGPADEGTAGAVGKAGDGASQVAPSTGVRKGAAGVAPSSGSYVLPLTHLRVPERLVDLGFWGALGGSAVAGLVDPPLAALLGAGVIVARHQARR